MNEQALFTLSQAAKATGRAKGTISKALKSGKLSYIERTDSGYQISAAELFRVFPATPETAAETVGRYRFATPEGNPGNAPLQREIATLLEERERERTTLQSVIEDLRADRDHWRQQAERTTNLLADQRDRRSWWQRLFGR